MDRLIVDYLFENSCDTVYPDLATYGLRLARNVEDAWRLYPKGKDVPPIVAPLYQPATLAQCVLKIYGDHHNFRFSVTPERWGHADSDTRMVSNEIHVNGVFGRGMLRSRLVFDSPEIVQTLGMLCSQMFNPNVNMLRDRVSHQYVAHYQESYCNLLSVFEKEINGVSHTIELAPKELLVPCLVLVELNPVSDEFVALFDNNVYKDDLYTIDRELRTTGFDYVGGKTYFIVVPKFEREWSHEPITVDAQELISFNKRLVRMLQQIHWRGFREITIDALKAGPYLKTILLSESFNGVAKMLNIHVRIVRSTGTPQVQFRSVPYAAIPILRSLAIYINRHIYDGAFSNCCDAQLVAIFASLFQNMTLRLPSHSPLCNANRLLMERRPIPMVHKLPLTHSEKDQIMWLTMYPGCERPLDNCSYPLLEWHTFSNVENVDLRVQCERRKFSLYFRRLQGLRRVSTINYIDMILSPGISYGAIDFAIPTAECELKDSFEHQKTWAIADVDLPREEEQPIVFTSIPERPIFPPESTLASGVAQFTLASFNLHTDPLTTLGTIGLVAHHSNLMDKLLYVKNFKPIEKIRLDEICSPILFDTLHECFVRLEQQHTDFFTQEVTIEDWLLSHPLSGLISEDDIHVRTLLLEFIKICKHPFVKNIIRFRGYATQCGRIFYKDLPSLNYVLAILKDIKTHTFHNFVQEQAGLEVEEELGLKSDTVPDKVKVLSMLWRAVMLPVKKSFDFIKRATTFLGLADKFLHSKKRVREWFDFARVAKILHDQKKNAKHMAAKLVTTIVPALISLVKSEGDPTRIICAVFILIGVFVTDTSIITSAVNLFQKLTASDPKNDEVIAQVESKVREEIADAVDNIEEAQEASEEIGQPIKHMREVTNAICTGEHYGKPESNFVINRSFDKLSLALPRIMTVLLVETGITFDHDFVTEPSEGKMALNGTLKGFSVEIDIDRNHRCGPHTSTTDVVIKARSAVINISYCLAQEGKRTRVKMYAKSTGNFVDKALIWAAVKVMKVAVKTHMMKLVGEQAGDGVAELQEVLKNEVKNITGPVELAVSIFSALSIVVCVASTGLVPSSKNARSWIQAWAKKGYFLRYILGSMKDIKMAYDYIKSWTMWITDYVVNRYFPHLSVWRHVGKFQDEAYAWHLEACGWIGEIGLAKVQLDREAANDLILFYNKGHKLIHDIMTADNPDKASLTPCISLINTQLSRILPVLNCAHRTSTYDVLRPLPYLVWYYGTSRCGKSTFMRYAVNEIATKEHGVYDKARQSCSVNSFEEFMSTYYNQYIVLWDDVSVFTNEERNIKELAMLMNFMSTDQLSVLKAIAEEKGMMFTSSLIMCASNLPDPNTKGFAHPKRMTNRRDLCVEVAPYPEYCVPGTDALDQMNLKVGQCYSEFRIYDKNCKGNVTNTSMDVSNRALSDWMTGEAFMAVLMENYKKHRAKQAEMRETYLTMNASQLKQAPRQSDNKRTISSKEPIVAAPIGYSNLFGLRDYGELEPAIAMSLLSLSVSESGLKKVPAPITVTLKATSGLSTAARLEKILSVSHTVDPCGMCGVENRITMLCDQCAAIKPTLLGVRMCSACWRDQHKNDMAHGGVAVPRGRVQSQFPHLVSLGFTVSSAGVHVQKLSEKEKEGEEEPPTFCHACAQMFEPAEVTTCNLCPMLLSMCEPCRTVYHTTYSYNHVIEQSKSSLTSNSEDSASLSSEEAILLTEVSSSETLSTDSEPIFPKWLDADSTVIQQPIVRHKVRMAPMLNIINNFERWQSMDKDKLVRPAELPDSPITLRDPFISVRENADDESIERDIMTDGTALNEYSLLMQSDLAYNLDVILSRINNYDISFDFSYGKRFIWFTEFCIYLAATHPTISQAFNYLILNEANLRKVTCTNKQFFDDFLAYLATADGMMNIMIHGLRFRREFVIPLVLAIRGEATNSIKYPCNTNLFSIYAASITTNRVCTMCHFVDAVDEDFHCSTCNKGAKTVFCEPPLRPVISMAKRGNFKLKASSTGRIIDDTEEPSLMIANTDNQPIEKEMVANAILYVREYQMRETSVWNSTIYALQMASKRFANISVRLFSKFRSHAIIHFFSTLLWKIAGVLVFVALVATIATGVYKVAKGNPYKKWKGRTKAVKEQEDDSDEDIVEDDDDPEYEDQVKDIVADFDLSKSLTLKIPRRQQLRSETSRRRPKSSVQHKIYDGDRVSKKKQIINFRRATEQNVDKAADDLWNNKISQAQVLIHVASNKGLKTSSGLFVKGKVLLMNKHMLVSAFNCCSNPVLYIDVGSRRIEVQHFSYRYIDRTDTAVVLCKTPMLHPYADLTKHLISKSHFTRSISLNQNITMYTRPMSATWDSKNPGFRMGRPGIAKAYDDVNAELLLESYPEQVTKYIGATSDFRSEEGQCGSVYLIEDVTVQGKIFGIHLGELSIEHPWLASPTIREEVVAAIVELDPTGSHVMPAVEQVVSCPTASIAGLNKGLIYQGKLDPRDAIKSSSPSKFVPTRHHGVLAAVTHAPAVTTVSDTRFIRYAHDIKQKTGDYPPSPLISSINKYGSQMRQMAFTEMLTIVLAIGNFFATFVSSSMKPVASRILTFKEAINGIAGWQYASRLDMTTAAGFGYPKGPKRNLFVLNDEQDWDVADTSGGRELIKNYESVLKTYQLGMIPTLFWATKTKDELRPWSKIEKCSTRVFQIPPLHFTIICRQYFMCFQAWYTQYGLRLCSAVGIDPFTNDWSKMMNAMREKGIRGVNGDFEAYDGHMSPQFIDAFADIVNIWYLKTCDAKNKEQTCKDNIIRKQIMTSICYANLVIDDKVVFKEQGNPSGCGMTTILNTVVNLMYMYYAWRVVMRQNDSKRLGISHFLDDVCLFAYGDDNMLTIKKETLPIYNGTTIEKALRDLGIVYTLADKSGRMIADQSVDSFSFLKRSFKYDANSRKWMAPLETSAIMKQLNHWQPRDYVEYRRETIHNITNEMMFHGHKEFDKLVLQMKPLIAGVYPEWSDVYESWVGDYDASAPFVLYNSKAQGTPRLLEVLSADRFVERRFALHDIVGAGIALPRSARIFIAGGDGTHSTVVHALTNGDEIPAYSLTFLPTGTGNEISNHFQHSMDSLDERCEGFVNHRLYDVKVDGKKIATMLGFIQLGFSAEVVEAVEQKRSNSRFFNYFNYIVTGIQGLAHLTPVREKVSLTDAELGDAKSILVSSINSFNIHKKVFTNYNCECLNLLFPTCREDFKLLMGKPQIATHMTSFSCCANTNITVCIDSEVHHVQKDQKIEVTPGRMVTVAQYGQRVKSIE